MISLSKRLKAISDYIDENDKIVDIGCDHGLLDIYLYQTKKNINIIASDINENALAQARKNISRYNLDKYITTRLSNGLDNISINEVNTVVISGMGAHTIIGILHRGINKLKYIDKLIIQSNNHEDFLRKRVLELGYHIECENLVKEKDIIYTIICFKKGYKYYKKKEIFFGPCLLKEKSNLFKEKNYNDLEKLKQLYKIIPKNHILHRLKTKYKIKMYKNI